MRRFTSTVVLAAVLPAAAWAQDACEAVKAAYDKLGAVTDYSQTIDMHDGAPVQMIAIGDTIYYGEGGGEWMKMPLDPGTRRQMLARTIPSAASLSDCATLGADAIDGAAMTVLEYTPPPIGDIKQDKQKVWIGDADGLPHRMTMQSEAGPMEVTLSFEGVKAPM